MARKKQINIIVIILGILLTIFLLNYFGIFDDLKTKPITFSIVEPKTEKNSPYTCTSGIIIRCNVRGVIECNTLKGEEPIIIFRGSEKYGSGYDVAFAIPGTIGLKSYTYNGKQISNNVCNDFLYTVENPFAKIVYRSGDLIVCYQGSKGELARIYESGGNADTSSSLKSGEKCNEGKVRCEGESSKYSCSGEFKVEKSKDDKTLVFPIESLSYSSNIRGGRDYSEQKTISPGNIVYVTGGDKNLIEVEVVDITQECTQSECNDEKTGYYECINNRLSSNLTICDIKTGEICKDTSFGASCKPPFTTYRIEFTESDGDIKSGFTTNEPILMKISLFSQEEEVDNGNVKIQLYKTGGTKIGNVYEIKNFNFKLNQPISIPISNPVEIGKYYAVMDVTFNQKTITIPKDKTEDYYFRIAPPIMNSVNIRSPDRVKLFINKPVWVEVNVYDIDGPIEADKIYLDIKYNNLPVINIPDYEKPPIISGRSLVYKYVFTFATPGILEVSSQVEKAGVKSNWSSFSSEVKSIAILADFTNIGLFRCIQPSSQILTFEVKDSLGNHTDSVNTLEIIEPDTTLPKDISNSIVREGIGKYKFSYSFTKKGAHTFKLKSFSPDYDLGSEPRSGVIEVKDGCSPDECSVSKDCRIGEMCINGKCEKTDNPNTFYFIIIGAVILIIIIIFIIVRFSKRKSSPDIGFGGL